MRRGVEEVAPLKVRIEEVVPLKVRVEEVVQLQSVTSCCLTLKCQLIVRKIFGGVVPVSILFQFYAIFILLY